MRQAIDAEEDKYVRRKPSRHITAESEAFTFLYRARCYLGFFVMAQVSMLVWFSRSSPQSHPELHLTAPLSSGPPVPLTSPPSPPSPALERRADEAQRLAFWRVLERLQNPSDCRRASVYIFLPTPYQSGLGSQMRIAANSLVHAMALRRTFVLDAATSVYADPHRCPSRGFECFFQRASNCTAADVLSDLPPAPPAALEPNTSAAVQLAARLDELPRVSLGADVPPRVISGRASCTSKLTPNEIESLHALLAAELAATAGVGAPLASAPPPDLGWYVRLASAYLGRPNAQTEALAHKLTSDLRLGGNATERRDERGYVAVHIRRGDKTASEAVGHTTSEYAAAVQEVVRRRRLGHILLSSDDAEPYRTLPEMLQGEEAEVVYVPTNEWVRVPAAGPLVAAKLVEYYYQTKRAASPIDEGMLLIAQALIFSRAAAVVGTLTSNYLLVVVELAELQRPPGAAPLEVIDLDGNAYFPCGCQDPLPWGPKFNRQRVQGELAVN